MVLSVDFKCVIVERTLVLVARRPGVLTLHEQVTSSVFEPVHLSKMSWFCMTHCLFLPDKLEMVHYTYKLIHTCWCSYILYVF